MTGLEMLGITIAVLSVSIRFVSWITNDVIMG